MSIDMIRNEPAVASQTIDEAAQQPATAQPEGDPAQPNAGQSAADSSVSTPHQLDATVLPQGVTPTTTSEATTATPETPAATPSSELVFLYEVPTAGSGPTVDPMTLALIDVKVGNADAQAIIAQYGQGPIDTTSPTSQELIARYGAARFEAITRYGMAMDQVISLAERSSDKAYNDYKKDGGAAALRALAPETFDPYNRMGLGKLTTEPVGTKRQVEGAPPGWYVTVATSMREETGSGDNTWTVSENRWTWNFDSGAYYTWYVAQPGVEHQILGERLGSTPNPVLRTETLPSVHSGNEEAPTTYQVLHNELGGPKLDGSGQTYSFVMHRPDMSRFGRTDGGVGYQPGTRLVNSSADTVAFDAIEGWVTSYENIYKGKDFFDYAPAIMVGAMMFVVGPQIAGVYGTLIGEGAAAAIATGATTAAVGYTLNAGLSDSSFSWSDLGKEALKGAVTTAVRRWVENIEVPSSSSPTGYAKLGDLGVTHVGEASSTSVSVVDRFWSYLATGTTSGVLTEAFGGEFRNGFVGNVAGRLAGDLGTQMREELYLTPGLTATDIAIAERVISTYETVISTLLTEGDPAQAVARSWLNQMMEAMKAAGTVNPPAQTDPAVGPSQSQSMDNPSPETFELPVVEVIGERSGLEPPSDPVPSGDTAGAANDSYVPEPSYHPQLPDLLATNMGQQSVAATSFANQVAGRDARPVIDMDLALLSQDVYNTESTQAIGAAGWTRLAADDLPPGISTPLSSDASGFQAAIYSDGDGRYVLAFAGTNLTSMQDMINNGQQALGFESAQYRDAVALAQEAYAEWGDNLVVTGHSLGGGQASAAGLAINSPAVTFNSAGLSDATLRELGYDPATAREVGASGLVRHYSVQNDIVTDFQDGTPLPNAVGHRVQLENPNLITDPVRAHFMATVIRSLENRNASQGEPAPGRDEPTTPPYGP